MVTLDTDEMWREPGVFSNVPIACFVTAWARMKLNRVLQTLQFRTLYFDTGTYHEIFLSVFIISFLDSVIFFHKQPAPIESGLFFGELKSELDYNDFITHFVCLAGERFGVAEIS